jgi:hypothetical protein
MAFYVPIKIVEFLFKHDLQDAVKDIPYIIIAVSITFIALGVVSHFFGMERKQKQKQEKHKPIKVETKIDEDELDKLLDDVF